MKNNINLKLEEIERNLSSVMEEVADFGYTNLITTLSSGILLLPAIPRGSRSAAMNNLEELVKSTIKEKWLKEDLLLAIEPIYSILKIRML